MCATSLKHSRQIFVNIFRLHHKVLLVLGELIATHKQISLVIYIFFFGIELWSRMNANLNSITWQFLLLRNEQENVRKPIEWGEVLLNCANCIHFQLNQLIIIGNNSISFDCSCQNGTQRHTYIEMRAPVAYHDSRHLHTTVNSFSVWCEHLHHTNSIVCRHT